MKTAYIILPPFSELSAAPFVSEYCVSFMKDQLKDAEAYFFDHDNILSAEPQKILAGGIDVITIIHASVIAFRSSLLQMTLAFDNKQIKIAAPLLQNGSDDQRPHLPFPYSDEETFKEVSNTVISLNEAHVRSADSVSSEIFSCAASFIKKIPENLPIGEWIHHQLWMETPKYVAEGSIAHSFADYHTHVREDLIRLIPHHVHSILDVGCGEGALGRRIKQVLPGVKIFGVEIDAHVAAHAAPVYDHIYVMPAEDLQISEPLDCIICGDILEHLKNPWMFLKKLNTLLQPQGVVIGSVPNAGHWTVIEGLIKGRFSYIPAGILCWDHLRFFTKESLCEMLLKAGFQISYLDGVQSALTPRGEQFVRLLKTNMGDKLSLTTEQFLFRVKK
jgi:2-polyprenyl-3-methyl-5-hydroxy-6-metoxy-1,4-benzoquinol methylase